MRSGLSESPSSWWTVEPKADQQFAEQIVFLAGHLQIDWIEVAVGGIVEGCAECTGGRLHENMFERGHHRAGAMRDRHTRSLELQQIAQTMSISLPSPDLTPFHDAETLTSLFAVWGEEGLTRYETFGRLDLFLPLALAALLGTLVFRTWIDSPKRRLAWIPIAASIADYGENFIVHRLAKTPKTSTKHLQPISGVLTAVKLIGLIASVALIVWGFWLRADSRQPPD